MAVTSVTSSDGRSLDITIDGRFDFNAHQAFRAAYEKVSPVPPQITVDLSSTTYLDSSALGMLLLLRDHCGGDSSNIQLTGCNQDIKKILTISNFEQLFKIA
ncbi:MAG: STAS domain-containing protein [Enterobacterales bacterium]|nr:STAS domain-containing protein [Enterobacterales bacterium]